MNRGPHLCSRRMQPARMTRFTECSRWPAGECSRWPANAQSAWNEHNLHEMMWAGDRPITKLAGITGECSRWPAKWPDLGFCQHIRSKKWSHQQFSKNRRVVKNGFPYSTKKSWSNYFQPWLSFLTTFSRPPFFCDFNNFDNNSRNTNMLTKT